MQNLALCFPSALRRESLFSAISSLLSHEVNANIEVGIYTDNPSATPPFVKEGIEGLKKKGVFCTLHYLEKRKETIENLATSFDRELLNYALLPPEDGIGYGVNVNASMLGSAGSILISCDDDIISKPARIKPALLDALLEKMPSADKKEGDDERLLLYFTNRENLLDTVEEVDVNILQAYLDLFRQNEESNGKISENPILWINPGLYGDTGMGSARGTLSLTGTSRAFLHQDYEGLKLSREAINIQPQSTISTKTNLMGTQTAFYNKVPLAPFMPLGRNSDGLSGLLTRLIYPGSRAAYSDFALYHASDGTRNNPAKTLTWVKPSISDLAMIVAIVFRKETEEGFNYYGSLFSDIARLSNSSFVDHLHGAFSAQYTAVIEYYEKLLERYNREPASWAADMETHIENIQEKMRNPLSLFGKEGCDLSIERAKYHLEHYGEVLKIWPDLWKSYSS